jgi:hypothetical protein
MAHFESGLPSAINATRELRLLRGGIAADVSDIQHFRRPAIGVARTWMTADSPAVALVSVVPVQ